MTDTERLTELEAELAVLKQQVAYEGRERVALQKIVLNAQGKLQEEVETAQLSKTWFDEHFDELSTAMGEGKDAATIMEMQVKFLGSILTQQSRMIDWFGKLLGRVVNLESERELIRR